MNAEILTIGDELLIGQVVNTNQAFIAEQLTLIGIEITRMTTVGDQHDAITDAFANAWKNSDVVIVTGGLGPTCDDITKKALCEFFDTDMVTNPDVRTHIEQLLRSRGIPWTPAAEEQTLVPRNARVLPNDLGTAPGFLFEEGNRYAFVLPGVPYEMKEIVTASIIPFLSSRVKGSHVSHLTLRTTGITESQLVQQLGNIDEILGNARLAFLPSPTGVRLRITARGPTRQEADFQVRAVDEGIRARIQKHVYGTGDEELEEVLGRILTERHLTLAVAESCTGGLIANRITNVGGSSRYFERGLIAYSNEAKTQLLGVPKELIEVHGAVSKEVAISMALGIRRIAGTAIGISTTGIAGPTGGTPEKPVGLVWIGYADGDGSMAMKSNFGNQRLRVKERAAQAALELVRRRVLGVE